MILQFDPLRKSLAESLCALIQKNYQIDVDSQEIYGLLMDPPNPDMGDYAFPCFILAKTLKKSPPQIAQELSSAMASGAAQAIAVGPYLNFKFSVDELGAKVCEPILSGEYFKRKLAKDLPKTMIEYSQPNTHKELHVGHMRNACLGDAVVRMHRYVGYEIISTTFPGDVGTHVAKCLWYLKNKNTEPIPHESKGEWLGQIYSKAHLLLEDEIGTAKEEQNRAELTAILKQLEQKNGEYYDLWSETRQWSIDLMNSIYEWIGIQFDRWYWESDVDADSVKYIQELYKQGHLIQSEGAIGMDLEEEKLGFCLLLKSDGTGLYATKDVELARRKFNDFSIQKSIYVVDMRQALHFKQVFKVLEKLGFEQAKNCFHLQYNFVELPDGAMSSRKGNIIPIMRLVREMEEKVKTQYLSRYQGEWDSSEINKVAHQVAQGAIKYGMLRQDTNKKIVFDMSEWLKIEGESGPFVQYSCARIKSLVRKLQPESKGQLNWSLLTHPGERALMQHLAHFNGNVVLATENYRPSAICTYLYELAKKFNYFYHECSIGQAESIDLKSTRLTLAKATGTALEIGLSILGIPAPDRM